MTTPARRDATDAERRARTALEARAGRSLTNQEWDEAKQAFISLFTALRLTQPITPEAVTGLAIPRASGHVVADENAST